MTLTKVSDLPNISVEDATFPATVGGMTGAITFNQIMDSIDADQLWEKMYKHSKKVIITCSYCGSHNALSNSNCVSCGAGMGDSVKGR